MADSVAQRRARPYALVRDGKGDITSIVAGRSSTKGTEVVAV
jgi:hypothetical protein